MDDVGVDDPYGDFDVAVDVSRPTSSQLQRLQPLAQHQ